MKKKLFCLLLMLILPVCLLFTGCSNTKILNEVDNSNTNICSFVVVESFIPSSGARSHYVLVHKQTRVMYLSSIEGSIEVMVDAEGKPLIYDGDLVI